MSSIAELIAAGKVRQRKSGAGTVAIGTTATLLLPANPMRTMVIFGNSEANAARVGRSPSVTTTNGTPLAGSGGALVYTREYLGEALGGEFWAVLDAVAGDISVEEYEAYQ